MLETVGRITASAPSDCCEYTMGKKKAWTRRQLLELELSRDSEIACLESVRAWIAADSAMRDDNNVELSCYLADLARKQALKTRNALKMVERRPSTMPRTAMRLFRQYARDATFAARQARSLEIPVQAILAGKQRDGPVDDGATNLHLA